MMVLIKDVDICASQQTLFGLLGYLAWGSPLFSVISQCKRYLYPHPQCAESIFSNPQLARFEICRVSDAYARCIPSLLFIRPCLYFSMHMYMYIQLVYIFIISNNYGAYFYSMTMLLQYNCITHTHSDAQHTFVYVHVHVSTLPTCHRDTCLAVTSTFHIVDTVLWRMLVLRVFVVWSYTDRLFCCFLGMT